MISMDKIIYCNYCSEVYEEPKFLPCGDSICLKCVQINKPNIDCKFCPERHFIETEKDLVTNQFLVKLIELHRETQMTRSGDFYDNLTNHNQDIDYKKYLSKEMGTKLANHFMNVKEKVDILNDGCKLAQLKIESECDQICEDIKDAVENLKIEIDKKAFLMLKDVESYKNELLIDYKERYETNGEFLKMKSKINNNYQQILNDLTSLDLKNSSKNNNQRIRNLIEKIELLNTTINDQNVWKVPDPNPSVGILFSRNNQPIHIPFIGSINYDSVYKIDMINKIKFINNSFQQRHVSVDRLFPDLVVTKYIGLISKNKIFILYEKVFGKVMSTFAKVVYFEGSVLHETEIVSVGKLASCHIYDKYILIAFHKSKNDHIVHLYDSNLNFLKDQSIRFEVESILMNDENIFLLSEKKPFINEYNHELTFRNSYGQKTKENKPFYIKDTVVSITNRKIFVKFENELRLICQSTGDFLSKVIFEDLKLSTIFLDFNKEKYLLYNGAGKITYFNHKGELLESNKLNSKETYDEFQFSKTGHFAFVNNKKNSILII